jgi:DNA polymerase III delta prime subunit
MPLEKQTHPFFKPLSMCLRPLHPTLAHNVAGNPSPERALESQDTPVAPPNDDSGRGQPDTQMQTSETRKKRARKSDGTKDEKERGPAEKVQAPLDRFTRPLNVRTVGESTPYLEEELNQDRRKRRKTASPPPIADHAVGMEQAPEEKNSDRLAHLQTESEKDAMQPLKASVEPIADKQLVPHTPENALLANMEILPVVIADVVVKPSNTSNPQVESIEVTDSEPKKTTPKKKILKITKNGKLTSPVATKSEATVAPSPKKRRKRTTSKVNYSTTVLIIRYGSNLKSRREIGKKIDDILGGKRQPVMHTVSLPKLPSKPTGPPKAPHPFFLGKAALKDETSTKAMVEPDAPASPQALRRSAVTPGKIRAESRMHQSSQSIPAFGPIGGSNKPKNQYGLYEPLWPSKDNAHVRNLESNDTLSSLQERNFEVPIFHARKLKSSVIGIPHDEDLIVRLSHELGPTIQKRYTQADMNFKPPEDVRLPDRLLTTGVDIQSRVRNQVRASLSHPGEQDGRVAGTHPAIEALYKDIEHTLTPFDRGTCESQSWVQKYAPVCASHVLQSGKEASVLRDWLQGLTVKSVISNAPTTTCILDTKKPPKKKRKKEVDDFIVWSDEEEEGGDLMEFSDSEVYGRHEGLLHQKSEKRPRVSRHKNVLMISGPHGCGKSATVYAVAKELGFEVFEINSSSRRSGKDVQDKVGDMSENHLVSNKRNNVEAKPELLPVDETERERMEEALQKDINSGRQGTMTSFFTSKAQPTPKPKPKVKLEESPKAPTSAQATLPILQAPKKLQKQSLILLEEADVLFEEDQQFWAQVIKLATLSKRPVVITCNNETRIPTYDLPLAAKLRLSPPPIDLAADYLLVMAAREGHVLDRKAVCHLLQSKDYDLRASITEMDFWCQMSVGDRKGGLEWIYQRWPPGKDVNENGRLIRVASQGTYLSGMGWLSHNVSVSADNIGYEKREELLREVWNGWGVSPYIHDESEKGMDISKANSQGSTDSNLDALIQLDLMAESVSAANVYCRVGLASYESHQQEPTDPSLPPVTDKELSGFALPGPVIQTDHVSDFTNFDTDMFITSHLCIQRAFGSHNVSGTCVPLSADSLTQTILRHKHKQSTKQFLTRPDFSEAFDILASAPSTTLELSKSYQLTPSSFDRTFRIISTDLAPYVRSIVAYERVREAERIQMSNLLSEGGTRKRPRTTRASRVAMEGGLRETKRRERWFDNALCFRKVMGTAGKSWAGLGSLVEDDEMERGTRGSSVSTQTQQE